jgi:hypothetical protein
MQVILALRSGGSADGRISGVTQPGARHVESRCRLRVLPIGGKGRKRRTRQDKVAIPNGVGEGLTGVQGSPTGTHRSFSWLLRPEGGRLAR